MVIGTNFTRCSARAFLAALLFSFALGARAADNFVLRPPDTSSPRATLQGFILGADEIYGRMTTAVGDYAESGRLYLTAEERREQLAALSEARKLLRYLDLSHVPPVLSDTVPPERFLQLKEVLDRIEIPPFTEIPDQDAMARLPAKRWRLPNTEIDIVQIENGPRAGEYLVAAQTIERLPEFYERVKALPYRAGPGQQLNSIYRKLSDSESATIYDAFVSSPAGLAFVVPPRWMLSLPDWAKVRVAGATAWQWLGIAIEILIGGLIVWLASRLGRRRSADHEAGPRWGVLLLPLAIMFVVGLLMPFLDTILRTGGYVRIVIEYAETGAVFLGAAWLAIVFFAVLGETIVAAERLAIPSLDKQLIRLGTRLVGIVVAIAILIFGGDQLGFPAYSVLAGLGVGGFAVALAAQSTIANLTGSLLLVMEKPFRVGQYVRIGASEGTVEDVGFRSTRIRTPGNSLVSIPSSAVVNTTVENLSVRSKRRQRFLVQVTYDTSRHQLGELVAGIRQLLRDNPLVEQKSCEVRFNNLAESSLDILVFFYLLVEDYTSELRAREEVLLQIIDHVNEAGIQFAFPTRTLHLEASSQKLPKPDESLLGLIERS
jgi:MscS family membrane protein